MEHSALPQHNCTVFFVDFRFYREEGIMLSVPLTEVKEAAQDDYESLGNASRTGGRGSGAVIES